MAVDHLERAQLPVEDMVMIGYQMNENDWGMKILSSN
jgi:hypothetical protein